MTDKGRERVDTRALTEKLLAVQEEVHRLEYTGTTAQNRQQGSALSIEDVEKAVGEQLAKHRIFTLWSQAEDGSGITSFQEQKANGGTYTMWQTRLRCTLINVDDPTDTLDAWWEDIGGTPSAASSFTAKGFYKRIFHIARQEDEKGESGARVGNQPRRESKQEARREPPPDEPSEKVRNIEDKARERQEQHEKQQYSKPSPHGPATAQQLATVRKLAHDLDYKLPENIEEFTAAEAGEYITDWGRDKAEQDKARRSQSR